MIEAALFRSALLTPVINALLSRVRQRRHRKRRYGGEAALQDAIRELLLTQPDERRVEAKLAYARATGVAPADLLLAETMLSRHRDTRARTRGKLHRSRPPTAHGTATPKSAPPCDPAHRTT